MAWQQKALASIAGMASGSVMTWMIMDNQAINAKRHLPQMLSTEPTEPTLAEKKAFFGITAATTVGLMIIRSLGER
jgi:hypothetical protein